MLWAVGGPKLLVPEALCEQLNPGSLQAIFAHELAHLRRRDHWVRVLEFAVLCVYWWLPVAWYACRRLREAEEQCCDAWVVAVLPGSGKAYASAILDTLDFVSSAPASPPLLASGIGEVTDLKRRLRMIMSGTTPHALGWRGSAAVLVLGLLLLPWLPAWVQGEQGEEAQPDRPEPGKRGRRDREEPPPQQVSDKVKAELKQLQDEVNKKAAELAEAGKKLQEVARKASPQEGGRPGPIRIEGLPPIPPSPPGGGEPVGFMLRKMGDNWVLIPIPEGGRRGGFGLGRGPGDDGPGGRGGPGRGPDDQGPGERGGRGERPMPPGRGPRDRGDFGRGGPPRRGRGRPRGTGRPAWRIRRDDLERRLDEVMRSFSSCAVNWVRTVAARVKDRRHAGAAAWVASPRRLLLLLSLRGTERRRVRTDPAIADLRFKIADFQHVFEICNLLISLLPEPLRPRPQPLPLPWPFWPSWRSSERAPSATHRGCGRQSSASSLCRVRIRSPRVRTLRDRARVFLRRRLLSMDMVLVPA